MNKSIQTSLKIHCHLKKNKLNLYDDTDVTSVRNNDKQLRTIILIFKSIFNF
jgi:hypothetical protein